MMQSRTSPEELSLSPGVSVLMRGRKALSRNIASPVHSLSILSLCFLLYRKTIPGTPCSSKKYVCRGGDKYILLLCCSEKGGGSKVDVAIDRRERTLLTSRTLMSSRKSHTTSRVGISWAGPSKNSSDLNFPRLGSPVAPEPMETCTLLHTSRWPLKVRPTAQRVVPLPAAVFFWSKDTVAIILLSAQRGTFEMNNLVGRNFKSSMQRHCVKQCS